jgi:serine/threonine-protein kinase
MTPRLPVRTFVGTLLLLGAVLAGVLGTALVGARRAAAASAERGLEQAADLVAQLLAGRSRSLAGGARVFVQGPYFRTLVAERRRDDILDQTFEAAEQLEASWVFITDASGVLVAKSDEPSASGDALAGVPLIAGALRGQATTGFGGSGDSLLFLATAVPITAPGGSAFGVLVATSKVDSTTAADIAVATGSHVVFYLRDDAGRSHITAATMPLDSAARAALSRALDTDTLATARPATGTRLTPQTIAMGDSDWFTYPSALSTAGGTEVGGYLVLRPASGALAGATWFRQALAVGVVLVLLLAGLATLLMDRAVAAPLRHLRWDVQRVAEGNPAAQAAPEGAAPEIAALAQDLASWRRTIEERDRLATLAAAAPAPEVEPALAIDAPRGRGRRSEQALALPRPVVRSGDAGPLHLEAGDWLVHRYHIEARLGGGPSGVLYRAFDRARHETVTLKLVRPELLTPDEASREAALHVIRQVGSLGHAHLARVHDVGDALETVFISSEWVRGTSLRAVLDAQHGLEPRALVAVARQLLHGLAALHGRHLVHGDLKPDNVLMGATGRLLITDAGIARLLRVSEVPARPKPGDAAPSAESPLGVSGRLMGATVGAPEYMAPEQLIGAPPSAVGDVYAVGIMLHEALRGRTPFGRQTPPDGLTAKLRETPGLGTPVVAGTARAEAPGSLEQWIAACIAPEPRDRPASARQALEQLDVLFPAE